MLFLLRRHPDNYGTIEIEREILALHKEHLEFGRKRLHQALAERHFNVDSFQLKRNLRAHKSRYASACPSVTLDLDYARPAHFAWLGREHWEGLQSWTR